jgi:hypothetical protein
MLKEPYRPQAATAGPTPNGGASLLLDPRKRPSNPLPTAMKPRWDFVQDSWENGAKYNDPARRSAQVAEWARNKRENTDYQQSDFNRNVGGNWAWVNWGKNAPKCNIFVGDALQSAGISVRDPENKKTYLRTKVWGNPKSIIPGFQVVREKPQVGDILSDGEHVGIYVPKDGKPATVSAAAPGYGDQVVHNDWGVRAQDRVTVWRYIGDQSHEPRE